VAASANIDHFTRGADYSNSMQRSATERKRETLAHQSKSTIADRIAKQLPHVYTALLRDHAYL
jgi:hypothetical protein